MNGRMLGFLAGSRQKTALWALSLSHERITESRAVSHSKLQKNATYHVGRITSSIDTKAFQEKYFRNTQEFGLKLLKDNLHPASVSYDLCVTQYTIASLLPKACLTVAK